MHDFALSPERNTQAGQRNRTDQWRPANHAPGLDLWFRPPKNICPLRLEPRRGALGRRSTIGHPAANVRISQICLDASNFFSPYAH